MNFLCRERKCLEYFCSHYIEGKSGTTSLQVSRGGLEDIFREYEIFAGCNETFVQNEIFISLIRKHYQN